MIMLVWLNANADNFCSCARLAFDALLYLSEPFMPFDRCYYSKMVQIGIKAELVYPNKKIGHFNEVEIYLTRLGNIRVVNYLVVSLQALSMGD